MHILKRVQPGNGPAGLMQRRSFLTAVGLALNPAGLGRVWAEEDADKPQEAAASLKGMEKVARMVTISELAEGGAVKPAECQAEPIFRYNNPTRKAHDATLWRWG